MFRLLRQPEISEQQFADDTSTVAKDLQTLKVLLESGA